MHRHVETGVQQRPACIIPIERNQRVPITPPQPVGEIRRFSFGEMNALASRVAEALRASGIDQGDRVGFFMPMLPELVAALMAVLKVGASAVPIFSAFGPAALATRLNDARATLLFTADGCYRRGRDIHGFRAEARTGLFHSTCSREILGPPECPAASNTT